MLVRLGIATALGMSFCALLAYGGAVDEPPKYVLASPDEINGMYGAACVDKVESVTGCLSTEACQPGYNETWTKTAQGAHDLEPNTCWTFYPSCGSFDELNDCES